MRRMGHAVAVVTILALMPNLAWMPSIYAAQLSSKTDLGVGYASKGYRLVGYRWDAVLGRRWAVYDVATHPAWPQVSELEPMEATAAGPVRVNPVPQAPAGQTQLAVKVAELIVRSGEAVTLWKNDGNVRTQLAAVSEGNGEVGDRVQLRVTGAGIFGNTGWRVAGVVRGPGSVEME